LLGVFAGPQGIADDGVLIDTGQPCGLSHAAAVLQVLEDSHGLGLGQTATEQGSTFALGETALAGAAGEHAALLRAIAETDAQVAKASQPVIGAFRVLTAEQLQFFHDPSHKARPMNL
jgi:hypothetical protein